MFYLVRQYRNLLLRGDITEAELEGKPIHLGLRQGIGAARFNGILGCDHEKQLLQGAHLSIDADLVLRHGL